MFHVGSAFGALIRTPRTLLGQAHGAGLKNSGSTGSSSLTISDHGRVRVGEGCFLNLGTMIACENEVTIGDHVMFANGCFVSDSSHRYDDRAMPVTWQGFTSKGPTHIGDNCWFGANCVVTSGVTIGERCVVGANSVVTRDLPPRTIAAGIPAKVLKEIEFVAGGD